MKSKIVVLLFTIVTVIMLGTTISPNIPIEKTKYETSQSESKKSASDTAENLKTFLQTHDNELEIPFELKDVDANPIKWWIDQVH